VSAPRRARPVLGIGRQFEAALTSAGVPASKSRREREKSKEANIAEQATEKDNLPQQPVGQPQAKKESTPNPKRKAKNAEPTVPNILQRSDAPTILQREAPKSSVEPSAELAPSQSTEGNTRGSNKRGRGRGGSAGRKLVGHT
jgi:regulator of nonsense transcripts 3